MSAYEIPATGSAEVHVLSNGYVGLDGDDERVSGTVTLIMDAGAVIDGVHACTHVWWTADGPDEDPLATDPAALTASRDLLLSFATVIIPGHGAPFRPSRAGSRS